MIYLCEVVSKGFQYFGSTMWSWTWYQSFYEEPILVLIKIWNRCCQKFERVSGSRFSVHLWPMEVVPLRSERHLYWEIVWVSSKIVSVSSKTVFVCSRNTHFGKSEGIMLQWRICFIFFINLSYFISLFLDLLFFSLGLLFSLTVYALFRAPCAIAANQK